MMENTDLRDSEHARIASFVLLMLSDGEISSRELVIICRHLTEAFSAHSLESILEAVTDSLEHPPDLESLVPPLVEGLQGGEEHLHLLRLFALAASDGLSGPELDFLARLARRLGLGEDEYAEMASVFGAEAGAGTALVAFRALGAAVSSAAALEGSAPAARPPAYFYGRGPGMALLVIDPRELLLNGRETRPFLVYPRFSDGDLLEIGDLAFSEAEVEAAFAAPPGTPLRGKPRGASAAEEGARPAARAPHVLEARDFAAGRSRERRFIVRDADFSLSSGRLCAIMGPAGSGKSTLLKALLGLVGHEGGSLLLDGLPLERGLAERGSDLGYVPQDDTLQGDLTVEENLRYKYLLLPPSTGGGDAMREAASLDERIDAVLADVGLSGKRGRIVGTEESRSLSGGERRRLNIAMELLGDPGILVLDEPTTGLSSQDAEEIVILLKAVAREGRLVLLVIHQPSAAIYELFDDVIIMGKDGRPVFAGEAFAALELFQASMLEGAADGGVKCPACGRVNPDVLMKALKTEAPEYWDTVRRVVKRVPAARASGPPEGAAPAAPPHRAAGPPGLGRQFLVQLRRSFLQKARDRSALLISLAGAPLLGAVCAVAFRSAGESGYSFRGNELYPKFLFMMIVSAIFLGLSSSCAEILKDRQMLRRERLSGASPTAYYLAKLVVLAFWGAAQGALFIAASHPIIGVRELWLAHWGILCGVSAASVATGLLVSAIAASRVAANNAVTMLCLVEILLGGGFLTYSSMGSAVWMGAEDRDGAPVVAAAMISRWGYEAVHCAEISLSSWERLHARELDERARLAAEFDERIRSGSASGSDKMAALNELGAAFAAERAKVEDSYNDEIRESNRPMGRAFLSPYDSGSRGLWAYAWARALAALALYTLATIATGLVLLSRRRI